MSRDALKSRDFWAGAIYVAVALAAFWLARDYRIGTAARMGSGYFPMLLAGALLAIGVVSIVRAMLRAGPRVHPIAWRPVVFIGGACVAFALLLEPAGFVAALAALCAIAACASREFKPRWTDLLVLAAFVAACALVFAVGLGVPLPLFGR